MTLSNDQARDVVRAVLSRMPNVMPGEEAFLQCAAEAAQRGVGFGWMQQATEMLWQEWSKAIGHPPTAWGPAYYEARIRELEARLAARKRTRERMGAR